MRAEAQNKPGHPPPAPTPVCMQVRQVSAQVHDIRGRVKHLVHLLLGKGFDVEVYQEPRFAACNLHMLYATRAT